MSCFDNNEDCQPLNLSMNIDRRERPSLSVPKIQSKITTEPKTYLVSSRNDKQIEASINHLTRLPNYPFQARMQADEILEWAQPEVSIFNEVKNTKVDYFGAIKKNGNEKFANEALLKNLKGVITGFRYDDKLDKTELLIRCSYLEEELKRLTIQNRIQEDLLRQRMHRCIQCLIKIS